MSENTPMDNSRMEGQPLQAKNKYREKRGMSDGNEDDARATKEIKISWDMQSLVVEDISDRNEKSDESSHQLRSMEFNISPTPVVVIYSPPEYNPIQIVNFLSIKLSLPIIDVDMIPCDVLSFDDFHEYTYMDSLKIVSTVKEQSYSQGFIVLNTSKTVKQFAEIFKIFSKNHEMIPLFLNESNQVRYIHNLLLF